MGKNQTSIEITDQETGEIFTLNYGSLVSDARDRLLSFRRQQVQATVWSKMSEDDQRAEIQMTQSLCDDLVRKVVDMVASGNHSVIHALMDNFKIKDGMVTVTAKGMADDGAVLALNSVGKKAIKIVVADAEQFDVDGHDANAEPDQPSMLPDGTENDYSSDDDLYAKIVKFTISTGKCSSSEIQGKFQIGYNKSARFVERMEKEGIVSAADNVGARTVLFTSEKADQEVEDIAADMDADLDQMDEPDDLHVDVPDEPVPDPASDDQVAGYHARMQGQPSTSGPDIDAPERDDWYLGWKKADMQEDAPEIVVPEVEADEPDDGADPVEQEVEDGESETTIEAEPETDAPDLGGLSPADHASKERLNGAGPDANPFDGGTDEHGAWAEAWAAADGQIKGLIKDGHDAAAAGADIGSSKWKAGSTAEQFWLEGFNSFKPDT